MAHGEKGWTITRGILLLGDMLLFILFSWGGKYHHGLETSFLSVIETSLPFMFTWLFIGAKLGVYRLSVYAKMSSSFYRITITWLLAAPVALLLRGLYLGEMPTLTFSLVTIGFMIIFLWTWRLSLTYVYIHLKHMRGKGV